MPNSDIAGQVNSNVSGKGAPNQNDSMAAVIAYLKQIAEAMEKVSHNAPNTSQSNAKQQIPTQEQFRRKAEEAAKNKKDFRSTGRPLDDFLNSMEDEMLKGLLGSDFKEQISGIFSDFTDKLGLDIKDIPGALGKELGSQVTSAFKNTGIGKDISTKVSAAKGKLLDGLSDAFGVSSPVGASGAAEVASSAAAETTAAGATAATEAATTATTTAATTATTAATTEAGLAAAGTAGTAGSLTAGLGAALPGILTALGELVPPILIGMLAISLIQATVERLQAAVGPAMEGFNELKESLSHAANRYAASRKEMQKNEKQRYKDDIETIIKKPFEILESAANKVYEVWDAQLRKINATQGYNKSDLQDLMSSYASRLRSEGLTNVVSSADIVDNLAKVLDSGLSGKVAEEFAYQATKLNAAVPTQDFFGYADVYASIASNALLAGQSEAEAIEYATEQLNSFANSVLYASREVSGGFSTGLKDAQSLFADAVKIAQAAKTNNASQLGGALTSISAVVGAVAPDLASSIVDSVVKAATGGNSSDIVALRSLAGINASNTEFLKALANNPQKIFSQLFSNLASLQNMSNDNYMEVAEGLSEIFGVSMDAFARVDFSYLADAISKASLSSDALSQNLDLLSSGETTTSAEQQKMAQINKYILEEGLSYVLDNEAARLIQEHMWQEQIANNLMEAEYGVELKGAALDFLEGISQTVQNLLDLINPFSWIKKLDNIALTTAESAALDADFKSVLIKGRVGGGNARELYNLTTRGQDLNLTSSLIEIMGGVSAYSTVHGITKAFNATNNLATSLLDLYGAKNSAEFSLLYSALGGLLDSKGVSSKYSWGTLGKSSARALANLKTSTLSTDSSLQSRQSATEMSSSAKAQSALNAKLAKMLSSDYLAKYSTQGYDAWAASAKQQNISDLDAALESAGYSVSEIKNYFQQSQVSAGKQLQEQRDEQEEKFWENTQAYLKEISEVKIVDLSELITQLTGKTHELLKTIYTTTDKFYDSWVDYYVNHTVYSKSYRSQDVDRIMNSEKAQQSDAVYALAEALTDTKVNLLDPAIQTNALLSQILLVVKSIMTQNTESSAGSMIIETLNGLARGITK